jgi:hypothetical protein
VYRSAAVPRAAPGGGFMPRREAARAGRRRRAGPWAMHDFAEQNHAG